MSNENNMSSIVDNDPKFTNSGFGQSLLMDNSLGIKIWNISQPTSPTSSKSPRPVPQVETDASGK